MHRYNVNTLSYFVMVPMIMITWYYMPICHRILSPYRRRSLQIEQMSRRFCSCLFVSIFMWWLSVSLFDYITCILASYLAAVHSTQA